MKKEDGKDEVMKKKATPTPATKKNKLSNCDLCNVIYSSKSAMLRHRRRKHEQLGTHPCKKCQEKGKAYSAFSYSDLEAHKARVHRKKK